MTESSVRTSQSMDLHDRLEVDQACLLFEDRLPTADNKWDLCSDLLSRVSSRSRERALYEMIQINLSGKPRDLIAEELEGYLKHFPEHASMVRTVVGAFAQEELPAGHRIGIYRIDHLIDRGASSAVYAAHGDRDEPVALKLFRVCSDSADECLASFRSEVSVLQRLRHPGIVPLLDFGCEVQQIGSIRTQQPYLVMPLYPFGTLKSELRNGPMPVSRAVSIVSVLADALASGHALGIVHGDVKPGNILLSNTGEPVLADFGLALNADLQDLRRGEVSGSPGYMAPEQLNGESQWLDGRADIWSLGVVLYEMLTGRKPFHSTSLDELACEIQQRKVTPICQVRPDVPQTLDDACIKCLQAAPGDRYSSAGQFLDVLRQISQDLPGLKQAAQGSAFQAGRGRISRRKMLTGFVILIATVILVLPFQNWMKGGVATPEILMAVFQNDKDDFQIRVRHRETVLSEDSVVALKEGGEPLELEVEADVDFYLCVVSLEPGRAVLEHPDPHKLEPPIFVRAGTPRRLEPLYPFHSGIKEYLLLLGSTSPIQLDSVESILAQLSKEPDTAKREFLFRGLSRTQDRSTTTLLIPYMVEPPTAISPSKSAITRGEESWAGNF